MDVTLTLTGKQAVVVKDALHTEYLARRRGAAEAAKIPYCKEIVRLNHDTADRALVIIELINLAIQQKDHSDIA